MSWDAAVEGAHPQGGVSARVDLHLGAHPSELPVVAAARRRRDFSSNPAGPARSIPHHSYRAIRRVARVIMAASAGRRSESMVGLDGEVRQGQHLPQKC